MLLGGIDTWPEVPGRGGGRSDLGASGRCRIVAGAIASGGDRRRSRVVRGVAAVLRRTSRGPRWFASGPLRSARLRPARSPGSARGRCRCRQAGGRRAGRAPSSCAACGSRLSSGATHGSRSGRRSVPPRRAAAERFGLELAGAGGVHEVDARVLCDPRLVFRVGDVVHGLRPYQGGCCLDRLDEAGSIQSRTFRHLPWRIPGDAVWRRAVADTGAGHRGRH